MGARARRGGRGAVRRLSARPVPVLHAVTDDAVLARPAVADTARAVFAAGGAALALHLRGPRTDGGRLFRLADSLRSAAREHGSMLVVNDRVDVALAVEADGVQLGGRSLAAADARRLVGPAMRIGVSVHGAGEVPDPAPDWLLVGTLWPTPSHPGRAGAGPGLLGRMPRGAPLVAIGGITVGRTPEAREAGACGIAVLGGIWDAAAPAEAVREFLDAWKGR